MQGFIDIGSTIIKIVIRRGNGSVDSHEFAQRDYEAGIARQMGEWIGRIEWRYGAIPVRICSSANGGIRVGLIALSRRFSGAVARHLLLAAGANLVFEQDFSGRLLGGVREAVDLLVIVGGVDSAEMSILERRLRSLDVTPLSYQTILYAGNAPLFAVLAERFPKAVRIDNILGSELNLNSESLLTAIRQAYLDDLVDRQGIREVQPRSIVPIWPTPGVVNLAFQAVARKECGAEYPDPFIVLDIGGATTDLHYGPELLADAHDARPDGFRSSNRHVFTDLGVFASRESAAARLLRHERLLEFLEVMYRSEANFRYAAFKETGVPEEILPEACFYLALDAAALGRQGMPRLDLVRLEAILLTGGVTKTTDAVRLTRLCDLFLPERKRGQVKIILDLDYRFWLYGLERVPALK